MLTISQVEAVKLVDVPVSPPPFREVPSRATVYLVRVDTTDGLTGWGSPPSRTDDSFVRLINEVLAPAMVGKDPLRIEEVRSALLARGVDEGAQRILTGALSAIDIALWDIRGKFAELPVHHLLGGARDEVEVYVTHGVAYGDQPAYSSRELADEAAELVRQGAVFLKTGVGRDVICSPAEDYRRLATVREAVGDDVRLAIDGASRMSLAEAAELARLCEPLGIEFLEEPVVDNDPSTMASLRAVCPLPLAAGSRGLGSVLPLLVNESVDILQANTTHDGGFTGALAVAYTAAQFGVRLGHGNGGGPHNVALLAGLPNGGAVEYHYLRWMSYNAVFDGVPQPENGRIQASSAPGVGLTPRHDVVGDYMVAV